MVELHIPQVSLVVLIGTSGSGKSTFAAQHFGRFEVVSSDFCRGLVSDDENDQSASQAAFETLHFIVGQRLRAGRLTVVDATNVQKHARAELVTLAREHDVLPVAIVLDVPQAVAAERNASRPDRSFGAHVIRRQHTQLRQGLRGLEREGFRRVHILHDVSEIDSATVVRDPLRSDLRHENGPFDVIGDVHGCLSELLQLLEILGYDVTLDAAGRAVDASHPRGRRVVFLGDLVDRGPDSAGVVRLAMGMTASGHALAVPGNHENKLVRALSGRKVQTSHGLAETLSQLAEQGSKFTAAVRDWCDSLVAHLVLDDGSLVVAHAGLKEAYHGRASGRVRSFALYGDTTGETDEFGLPVRYPWANDYRGRAMVLYGHTPTPTAEWINNTMCLDTGCVFGGRLSALRYPEREVVSVPAARTYYEPARPLLAPPPQRADDELHLRDVMGKQVIETAHHGRVSIRAENAAGALEVMSRFALAPRWLPYLPPTMAPAATSKLPDTLEHPVEAFADFAAAGVSDVICEEKHMGSRAVVWVHRVGSAAADSGPGVVYTRTGRPFLRDDLAGQFLSRFAAAADRAGLWEELSTDRLLFDCEIVPWSFKAIGLLRGQFAAVGAAAGAALPPAITAVEMAAARGIDVGDLGTRLTRRQDNAARFTQAYLRYCWETDGLTGVQVAPFMLLASDTATFETRDHLWHLGVADRLVEADPEHFRTTRRLLVDTGAEDSRRAGVAWWSELTETGGEGMVVKPLAGLTRGSKGLVQPGLKVRGREYLRLIYGPDYLEPHNLSRLKDRNLGRKRSLALREYALGLESLTRLVAGEPLWRIHEPVFGVLALESEPVDPRL